MRKRNTVVLLTIMFFVSGGCYKNEPLPSADFIYSGNNKFNIPCTVQFSNQSAQAYSYDWWFGSDSSVSTIDAPGSTMKDPMHVYTRPGKFPVTLRAYNMGRKEWASVIKIITIRDTIR